MAITPEEFAQAAKLIGCEVAAIRAVDTVEAAGDGFLPSGRLKVLFEGHKFYEFTGGKYAKQYPTLCYKVWTKKYYLAGEKEYDNRFGVAFGLDSKAAMKATSWGRYQIMGFNYKSAGYASVDAMIDDFKVSEYNQLKAFCVLVKHMGIDDELRRLDWAGFAKVYNGAGYKKNQYDLRLADAYKKFKH